MTPDRPDVEQLMRQIDEAAQQIEQHPVSSNRRFEPARSTRHVARNPLLDENWDSWEAPEVTSHRGLLGLPIVWFKRFSLAGLRLHDRELLKRQREYNKAAMEEIYRLRRAVADLSAEVAKLKRSRP